MKKHLLWITACVLSLPSFSQGIKFEHTTWEQVLAKAQQLNKPVFVDVFTSWCGPCKKMSTEIFPLEEVGKVYNADFVCFKIDAEQGEGPEIARKYEVKVYPTYLFVKPDGSLVYIATGSMSANDFIGKAEAAISEMKDGKSIKEWDAEYNSKKSDPDFLRKYMDKRSKLGMSNDDLFNDYIMALPESERVSEDIAEHYFDNLSKRNVILIGSVAYSNLKKNKDALSPLINKAVIRMLEKQNPQYLTQLKTDTTNYNKITNSSYIVNTILLGAITGTTAKATETKNEVLFNAAIKEYDSISVETELKKSISRDELCLNYYTKTNNTEKALQYNANIANSQMKIGNDSILHVETQALKQFEEQIKNGTLPFKDSLQIANMREYMRNNFKMRIAQKLNSSAWYAFNHATDKKQLKSALQWSQRSLELTPKEPACMDTYANLLYKLGKKKDAIKNETEAAEIIKKGGNPERIKGYETTLQKMKKGEKTW